MNPLNLLLSISQPQFCPSCLEQVRTVFLRALKRLLGAPLGDLGVIAGKEDVRHFHLAKLGGPGVVGVIEQAAGSEGFLDGGFIIAEDSGNETNDGIDHHGGSDGSIGQDVVAERKLFIDTGVDDPLIDPFVVAA